MAQLPTGVAAVTARCLDLPPWAVLVQRECPGSSGYGTVFRLTTNGSSYTILHSFSSGDAYPYGGLVQDTHGVLFGTTFWGGYNNNGTVFMLNTNGNPY